MAKGKGSIKGWITKNGVHIPIYGEYTVRGGVEPKAKGSKFKRKKRPEEFDKDIRESGGKYWAAHSSAQGKKQGVKDLDKPFDTKEEARAFLAKENGEYEDAKLTSKSESKQNYITDKDGNKIAVGEDARDANLKRLRERNANNPDVQARKAERADKENPEWLQAKEKYDAAYEKQKGNIEANREEAKQQARQKANEANSLVNEGMDKDQARKAVSEQESSNTAYDYNGQTITHHPNGVKPEFHGNEEYNYEVHPAKGEKGANQYFKTEQEAQDYINGRNTKSQASSTPDFSKMSYSEAGKYVSEHKKDFGLKPGDDAYQAAYEMKQGTWKQPKEEKKTVSTTESYPDTKSFGSSEPSASEYGKAMESIGKRYDSENRTVPGKEMGKVFEGLKPGDQIQVHNKYSVSPDRYIVNEDGTIDYSTPSSSFLGKKGMSLAEAQKHATNSVDNRITVMRRKAEEGSSTSKPIDKDAATSSNTAREQSRTRASYKDANTKIANGEHTVDIKTDGSKRSIANAKKAITKSAKKNDVQYGISEHKGVVTGSRMAENGATLDTQIRNMSVSGLKQAYNTATGTAKSKIRQELRRLGYTYVGGKWVKGNKS